MVEQARKNQGPVSLSDYDFKRLQRGPNGIIMPGTLYENYILNASQESCTGFHHFGLSTSTCNITVILCTN